MPYVRCFASTYLALQSWSTCWAVRAQTRAWTGRRARRRRLARRRRRMRIVLGLKRVYLQIQLITQGNMKQNTHLSLALLYPIFPLCSASLPRALHHYSAHRVAHLSLELFLLNLFKDPHSGNVIGARVVVAPAIRYRRCAQAQVEP